MVRFVRCKTFCCCCFFFFKSGKHRHRPCSYWVFLPPGLLLHRHHPALSHYRCRCLRRCWQIGVSRALSLIQSQSQTLKYNKADLFLFCHAVQLISLQGNVAAKWHIVSLKTLHDRRSISLNKESALAIRYITLLLNYIVPRSIFLNM